MSDLPANALKFSKPVPAIWLSVVKPKDRTKFKADPRFEATFLVDPDHPDFAALKAVMGQVAREKFGSTAGLKFPLQDGTKMADEAKEKGKDREFLRGKVVVSAHSNTKNGKGEPLYPPRLVVLQNDKYVRYQDDERALGQRFYYSGVLTIPTLAFAPYDTMGKGVTAYLNEVLSLNAGDKINTGADDEAKYGNPDAFKAYVGHVSAKDPTEGMGEEITF